MKPIKKSQALGIQWDYLGKILLVLVFLVVMIVLIATVFRPNLVAEGEKVGSVLDRLK